MNCRAIVNGFVLIAACQSERPSPAPAPTVSIAETASAATTPTGAASTTASPTALREEDVRALLVKWESAQNQGQFETYAGLYAERFVGVKRAGPRLTRFDRARWLADRKGLFQKPFTVRVEQLDIALSGSSAVVHFEQAWSNDTFRDTGPKRLVVTRVGQELRISSEEMLASKTGAEATSEPPDPREFSLISPEENNVLWLETLPNLDAVTDHPQYVSDMHARRAISIAALPKTRKELLGERFQLYGENGVVCEGVVEELFVDIALEPHFGTMQAWTGFEGSAPVPLPARALELWSLSEFGTRVLAARLKQDKPCDGSIWARAASVKAPTLWKQTDPTVAEEAAIWAAIRSDAAYRVIQQEYVAVAGKKDPWDSTARSGGVQVFTNDAGSSYAAVTLDSTYDESCASEFDPSLWLLLKKHGTGFRVVSAPMDAHVPSSWPRSFEPVHVDVAFDLDGDGVPEFASKSDLVRNAPGGFRAVYNLSPSYYSCPC